MHVAKFKNPKSARVELEAGENLLSVIQDTNNKLVGYQHSFNAIMDALKKDRNFKGRHWWLMPGDVLRLPALPADPEDGVRAGVCRAHHFQLHRKPQIIDVYIGFMDEEVNARLNKLIQIEVEKPAAQQRPVILLERGKIDPGKPILEWRMGNYKIGDKATPIRKILRVSPQGEMDTWETKQGNWHEGHQPIDMPTNLQLMSSWFRKYRLKRWADKQKESFDPEDIIARAMGVYMQSDLGSDLTWLARGLKVKKYFDIIKMLQHRGKSSTKSKLPKNATGDGPWLSVVRFDVGEHNLLAPIVVIRSPEMGLQPSLMCPYLAFLFKALSAASSEFAAIEAKQRKVIVHAKGGWEKSKNTDKEELWENIEENAAIYPTGKKLKKWPVWEWPLRVSQFGGQGSTSALEGFRPGSIDTVIASLLVGFEVSSDVGVTATNGSRTQDFDYQGKADSTEDAPHRVVRDKMLGPDEHVPKEPVPPVFNKKDVRAGQTTSHVYAVISLCTPAGIYDFMRQEVQPDAGADIKAKIEEAINTAQTFFWNNAMTIKTNMANRKIDEDNPFGTYEKNLFRDDEQPTLHAVISKIKTAYAETIFKRDDRNPVVTLTVTYFGGDKDKEAADALGIRGVAMEDYHVLRVLRSAVAEGVLEDSAYPIILDWRVDRINCDPKELPEKVEADFNTFYATKEKSKKVLAERLLSIDDYVKVIIWGMRGLRQEDIIRNAALKECLDWKYAKTIADDQWPNYFWSFTHTPEKADFFVPDPFCVEIATDFINELADMNPDEANSGIANLPEKNSRKKSARNLAKAVQKAWLNEDTKDSTWNIIYTSTAAEGTKAKIEMLMTHLRDQCNFGVAEADDTKVKTWLRPGGKWEGVGNIATLQEAANKEKFKAAAIDRAFYKSSNMMALQTFADHGLW